MTSAKLVPMDVGSRARRLRDSLEVAELDAFGVTSLTNLRWLTGFTGSNAAALVRSDGLDLFTDGRYADQAPAELMEAGVDAQVIIGTDVVVGLAQACPQRGRVGLEANDLSWTQQRRLAELTTAELVPTSDTIEALRAIKDAGELSRMSLAASIVDTALTSIRPMLAERPSERHVALALDHALREAGATSSAYETIVASGPNASLPHARPTDRSIELGDLVVIDVGALVDGYRSDMTRTFSIGEPEPAYARWLEVVREAQAAGVAAVRGGVAAQSIDQACREIIIDAGWGDEFSHGAGHGVGLDIHEHPRINSRSNDIVSAGMVITVEPGVYFAGRGGVRWEDLLHVTATGAQTLTQSPKDAVIA